MFLTKKSLWKILIMAICYIALGSVFIALAMVFTYLQIEATMLFVLGIVVYLLCPLIVLWGKYAEGEGKWIHLGNKLVRNELKPAEFLRQYYALRNAPDLVINKPKMDILGLVIVAYDVLDDRENCLSAVEEMIAVAGEKKKAFAKLIKASILFSYGRNEEAEALFSEVQGAKLSFQCQAMADAIWKGDRAIAMGDDKTAELHFLKLLSQTFPKPDNLVRLMIHFQLGEIYERQQNHEKAMEYYQYCVQHGGETAIKESARLAWERCCNG
jgi:tetratricopeptide (TPR) repeat protein